MTSSHVISPVGERIEITSDDDWLTATGGSNHGLRTWNAGGKRWIIRSLWEHGPANDPKSGRASKILFDRIRKTWPESTDDLGSSGSSSTFLGQPMNSPMVERITNGKRTYLIGLRALPQTWFNKLNKDIENDTSPIPPEIVPDEIEVVTSIEDVVSEPLITPAELAGTTDDEFDTMIRDMQLDAPTTYDDLGPRLDISIASQVAMSLLTTVVEIITAGTGAQIDEKVRRLQGDLKDVMEKLSARLEDNDRMRRQLRQAGDEMIALRHERDGLRSRLRATEANLTAALKGDAVAAINGEIQKRVDSIMRVAPTTKGEE